MKKARATGSALVTGSCARTSRAARVLRLAHQDMMTGRPETVLGLCQHTCSGHTGKAANQDEDLASSTWIVVL
jgi:hypothetical protein